MLSSSLILIYFQSSGVTASVFIIDAQLCVHVHVISPIFFFFSLMRQICITLSKMFIYVNITSFKFFGIFYHVNFCFPVAAFQENKIIFSI